MESSSWESGVMISYKIVHHVPGRIRIAVPFLERVPLSALPKLRSISLPDGILAVKPNFLSRNLVIKYDPTKIDILDYLRTMASHLDIEKVINDGTSEPAPTLVQP